MVHGYTRRDVAGIVLVGIRTDVETEVRPPTPTILHLGVTPFVPIPPVFYPSKGKLEMTSLLPLTPKHNFSSHLLDDDSKSQETSGLDPSEDRCHRTVTTSTGGRSLP